MAFKMKGSSLYGKLNLNRGGNQNKPDGRAKSSAFQDTKGEDSKDGAPFLGAALGVAKKVIGGVKKAKGVVDKVKGVTDKVKDVASKIPGFKKHGDSEAEKPGAPAIWPFKKKTPGGAQLVKVKKKKEQKGKKIRTRDISKPDLATRLFYKKKKKRDEVPKKKLTLQEANRRMS